MDQNSSRIEKTDSASRQSESPLPKRILVVEDEPFIRKLNTKVLANSRYQVDAAEDGAAAWQALTVGSYDLLITDHNMPKVTGLELLEKVRTAGMALPVIMATGTLPMEEFTQSLWLNPGTILPKPYTIDDLLRTVNTLLGASNVRTLFYKCD